MKVVRIVATLDDHQLGETNLEMALTEEFRRRGFDVGGQPDGKLMAVLEVPSSTADGPAQLCLVEALQLVARATVEMAAASGELLMRRRAGRQCIS